MPSVDQRLLPITRGLNATIAEGLAIEAEQFTRMVPTDDLREALDAWITRRTPSYQGR
jgi:enoyl-CoA hydratase